MPTTSGVSTRASFFPFPDGSNGDVSSFVLYGFNGNIATIQNVGDEFQRLGQSGTGQQILGSRGKPSPISGWTGFSDVKLAVAFLERWESLETRICAIVDSFSRNNKRVRLTGCSGMIKNTRGPLISGVPITHRVVVSAYAERLPDA
jgi:hypothetical protein